MKKIQLKRRYRIIRLRRLKNQLGKLLDTLTLSGLYELHETTTDERLEKKVEQRILEMAVGNDDLLEIVVNETDPLRAEAWKELSSRIQRGRIEKKRARQILKRVLSVPELRKEAWNLFKTLDPTDERELKEIQGSDFIKSEPSIAYDIEQLLKKRHKRRKDSTTKTVEKIQEIVKKINELKKGQE